MTLWTPFNWTCETAPDAMIAADSVIQSPTARYVVHSERGRGGFGVAWLATREHDGSHVILKELRLDRLEDWKAMQLFEREAAALAGVRHPGIPSYVEFFGIEDAGQAFKPGADEPNGAFSMVLVQSYIPGQNLAERMTRGAGFGADELTRLLDEQLQVLQYLHELSPPVIHRDITPKNIVRGDDGRFYLVDFGAIQDRLRSGTALGSTNVGTFGFMPMEQAMGRAQPASDLFSLAMSVLVAGTGRQPEQLPFDESTGKVARSAMPSSWPPALVSALDAMLEPIVGKRIQTAREALQLLRSGPKAGGPRRAGENRPITLAYGETVQVGRAETVDIRIPDASVSRFHAMIERRSRGYVVRDLGSARGTFVDGHRVTEVGLENGASLRFGTVDFAVRVERETLYLDPLQERETALARAESTGLAPRESEGSTVLAFVGVAILVALLGLAAVFFVALV